MTRQEETPAQFRVSIDYLFTVISAWLIPGSGHWLLGYRARGTVLGALILGLFWVGQALAYPPPSPDAAFSRKPLAVSRKVSPIFFACQAGNGFSALLSNSLWGEPRYGDSHKAELDRHLPRRLNLAILFTSVSGLLNYLLVLHIMDPRSWIEASQDRAPGERKRDGPGDDELSVPARGARP